jgi:hypothetical protein
MEIMLDHRLLDCHIELLEYLERITEGIIEFDPAEYFTVINNYCKSYQVTFEAQYTQTKDGVVFQQFYLRNDNIDYHLDITVSNNGQLVVSRC